MLWRTSRASGFTLIELMIVVAIIGILASIAIPNFIAMQLRAKRAEMPTNLDSVRTVEKAYEHEWDAFTAAGPNPSTVPAKRQANFGASFGDGSDWDLLGWIADGKVRAQYLVNVSTGTSASQDYSAQSYADIDGDGTQRIYVADKSTKPVMYSPNSYY